MFHFVAAIATVHQEIEGVHAIIFFLISDAYRALCEAPKNSP